MYGIPIKFRAARFGDGKPVFGSLIADYDAGKYFILTDDKLEEVSPISICQLAGYDADGNEVYKSDSVYRKCGNKIFSALILPSLIDDAEEIEDIEVVDFHPSEYEEYRLTDETKKLRPLPVMTGLS